ncbi:unnamed protein product, partial [Nesidiocoris tenuis]
MRPIATHHRKCISATEYYVYNTRDSRRSGHSSAKNDNGKNSLLYSDKEKNRISTVSRLRRAIMQDQATLAGLGYEVRLWRRFVAVTDNNFHLTSTTVRLRPDEFLTIVSIT